MIYIILSDYGYVTHCLMGFQDGKKAEEYLTKLKNEHPGMQFRIESIELWEDLKDEIEKKYAVKAVEV
ncbi:hypothetical protein IX317_000601 [Fusobacterium sp. DD29]|uniref:hypothetical protein n=1 Tax=unclassified Fusobacterium TaxID=2648384 RepID=UPI001B8B4201|nr:MULTISPECIES: hypothetical protein [unclassified Fusobacterium]MBR8700277.1 hypothetical protein [Fusobacterium sp. DD45]MBR8710468.1 hypothetical protein [Fusobacterium sp. DD28]MBR8748940.1 hypothetical protein [Fusobacterium sp. DD29]MBR8751082.1 hypothetical protein [Fusobacterium sp. DD26]MBR8761246.1 hypothetical protein [Fusobacterium sp. DD25]